jgi:hypothetical protein
MGDVAFAEIQVLERRVHVEGRRERSRAFIAVVVVPHLQARERRVVNEGRLERSRVVLAQRQLLEGRVGCKNRCESCSSGVPDLVGGQTQLLCAGLELRDRLVHGLLGTHLSSPRLDPRSRPRPPPHARLGHRGRPRPTRGRPIQPPARPLVVVRYNLLLGHAPDRSPILVPSRRRSARGAARRFQIAALLPLPSPRYSRGARPAAGAPPVPQRPARL